MSESREQQIIFEWASWQKNKYPGIETMYHIANEGKRSASNGSRLKREGLKSGVSDICVPVAKCGYNNLYIELKSGKNKATKEQLDFRYYWLSQDNNYLTDEYNKLKNLFINR